MCCPFAPLVAWREAHRMRLSCKLLMCFCLPISTAFSQTSLQQEAAGTILGAYMSAYALHQVCATPIQTTETIQRHRAAWREYQNRWHPYAAQTLQMFSSWRGQNWANSWYDRKVAELVSQEYDRSRSERSYCFRMSQIMYSYLDMRNCCANELRLLFPGHRF